MNRLSLAASAIAALAVCALLGLSFARVRGLMARELDRVGPWTALAEDGDATLLEADLLEGDDLTFELCSEDSLDPTRWVGAAALGLDAGDAAPRDRVLDETIDAGMLGGARRGSAGACLDFAHAGPLEQSGHYVVVVRHVTSAVAGVRVRARVLAERPLGAGDRNDVLGVLLGAMALVIALALRKPADATAPTAAAPASGSGASLAVAALLGIVAIGLVAIDPRLGLEGRLVLGLIVIAVCGGALYGLHRGVRAAGAIVGVVAVLDLSTLLAYVTPPGPAWGLLAGLTLAGLEVAIALGLARMLLTPAELAIQRPSRVPVAILGFLLAPVVGVFLRLAATRVLAMVPATGEAPIEAYVSWPSGLLSFAALSAIAPIGEEVFFRGLVYGAIRGQGGARNEVLAFVGAWLLFVIAHLPQTWGSWGGLAAIAIAGLGFTTLRAATGSVLVAALAHLVYNGLLAVQALTS